jgi:hypothetical protein
MSHLTPAPLPGQGAVEHPLTIPAFSRYGAADMSKQGTGHLYTYLGSHGAGG